MRKVIYFLAATGLLLGAQPSMAKQKQMQALGSEASITYLYLSNGDVYAFPDEYVAEFQKNDSLIEITDKGGAKYRYLVKDVTIREVAPNDLPTFVSFKFNNKFNDMLMVDAEGVITGDSVINVTVGSIGKRLTPSFQLSDENALVYVGDALQTSKSSSQRFETPTNYTLTKSGYKMLRQLAGGEYVLYPFGRDYIVRVDFLCDHPTTEYGIPVVRITTDDGTDITSKDDYWSAKISIDGAGFFPNLAETAMEIKGRGNMSWSDYDKKSYRIKFDKKQKPLGLKAGKNWNLIASAQTGSMMTNAIGQRLSEMVGVDAANHFIPVELYLNGEYRGSYSLTEKVGFANNSIDIADESNATLLELDKFESSFITDAEFDTLGLPVYIHYPDLTDSKDETNLTAEEIEAHFNRFITALRNGQDVSAYLDFQSAARYLMVNDLLVNYELMHPKSVFCYNENIKADSLYHFGPAWDFDWCFGYETGVANNDSAYFNWDAHANYYETTSDNLERTRFIHLLRYSGEEMNRQYYRVWHTFVTEQLEDLCEYCTDYYNVTNQSFVHNDSTWHIDGKYDISTGNCIDWLRDRATWIYDYLSNTLGYAGKGYLDAEDNPAGIQTIASSGSALRGVFSLQGQRIHSDISSLPSGIYVANGRKLIVR